MSSLSADAGQIYTCKHLMRIKSAAECVFCHRDQLAQEIASLRSELTAARLEMGRIKQERLTWAMCCDHDCPACTALDDAIRGDVPAEHPSTNQSES